MKIYSLFIILLPTLFILGSCGKKEIAHKEIIAGGFYNFKNISTLDLEKLQDLPRVIDLKNQMTPVKDQGIRGTCGFFAAISLAEAAIKKETKKDINLSEEFLNYSTKSSGLHPNVEASSPFENLSVLVKQGVLLEEDAPYLPSWFGKNLPCSQFEIEGSETPSYCYSHMAPSEESMKRVFGQSAFEIKKIPEDTNEVIKFLAKEQRPFLAILPTSKKKWLNSMPNIYSDVERFSCVKEPENCGNHVIVITGYDLDKKIFFFRNQYDKSWGDGGYGTISFETFDLFSDRGYFYLKLIAPIESLTNREAQRSVVKKIVGEAKYNEGRGVVIQITGNLERILGKTIIVQSYLVKKQNIFPGPASNKNSERLPCDSSLFNINNRGLAGEDPHLFLIKYFPPSVHSDFLSWGLDKPLSFNFKEASISFLKVKKLFDASKEKLFVESEIYSHTDRGLTLLSRIYSPVE